MPLFVYTLMETKYEQSYLENILCKTNPIVMLLVDIWEFAKIRDRYFWYKMPQDIKDFGVENVTSPSLSYPPSNVTSPIFSNPNSSYRYFQIQRFACSICDKVFYRCSYCERHITTAHSDFCLKISSYSLILAKTNHRHTCTTYSLQIVKRATGRGKEALLFEALNNRSKFCNPVQRSVRSDLGNTNLAATKRKAKFT